MRADDTLWADFDTLINHGVRPNRHGRVELRFGMNDGCGMNHE